jgi:hypothetical protein
VEKVELDNKSIIETVEWFKLLPNTIKEEKLSSMRSFYDNNTNQLMKIIHNLEKVNNCPKELILNAKKLVSNNVKIVSEIEKIQMEIKNAEKKNNIKTD